MLAMTFEDGLNILKKAFSITRTTILAPESYLTVVHAYCSGWMEDPKGAQVVSHFNPSNSFVEYFYDADTPFKNLVHFIKSKKSKSVSFLRPSLVRICNAYKSNVDTFNSLYNSLNKIPLQWYDEYWGKAFDVLLGYIQPFMFLGGAEFTQPSELSSFITGLSRLLNPGLETGSLSVFDPFAGMGRFLNPGHNSFGQELNEDVCVLSRLRTLALGYYPEASNNYLCSDSTKHWAENSDCISSFDAIVSFPPMGIRQPVTKEMSIAWSSPKITLEDYYLYKGSESLNPGGHLTGLLLSSVLYAEGPTAKLREKLVYGKQVKLVIQLPANLLYNTGVSTCVIVLSDKTCHNDEILFMDASTFYSKEKRRNVLQTEEVLNILAHKLFKTSEDGPDSPSIANCIVSVPIDEVIAKDCSLVPSRYLMGELEDTIEIPEGYEAVPLKEIVSMPHGESVSLKHIRRIRGKDLIADGPIEYQTFEGIELEDAEPGITALHEDAILVLRIGNLKPTLYKAVENNEIALNSNVTALAPKEGIDPYYLVSELRKPYVTDQVEHLSQGVAIPYLKIRDLLAIRVIMPLERKLQHEAFLTNQRLEKEQQLKSLQFDEYIKRERGRLDAMMSIRRHRINPYISGLQNNVSMLLDELFANDKLTPGSELSPNYSVQDALENMEENLAELKYLFDAFTVDTNVGIAESIDLVSFLKRYNYTRKMPDRQFSLEKYLFEKSEHYPNIVFNGANLTEVLDEIIHNAEKHFSPNTPDCSVWLHMRPNGKNVQLLILNNGEPVPADFDEERSFVAGYHKDENGTGQGLFRVRQLCDEFGAKIAWENDPDSVMATGLCITFKTSLD